LRKARLHRKTAETEIKIALTIEGRGKYEVSTGIRFLDHMLELFARHGGFDLKIKAVGDLEVDQHHTVEDVGIALGEVFDRALGDRRGILRAGYFVMPMTAVLAAGVGVRHGWGPPLRSASFRLESPPSGQPALGILIPEHGAGSAVVDLLSGVVSPSYGELRVLGEIAHTHLSGRSIQQMLEHLIGTELQPMLALEPALQTLRQGCVSAQQSPPGAQLGFAEAVRLPEALLLPRSEFQDCRCGCCGGHDGNRH